MEKTIDLAQQKMTIYLKPKHEGEGLDAEGLPLMSLGGRHLHEGMWEAVCLGLETVRTWF